jgi:hypothetical protein
LFSFGILAVAGILAIGANATNLMATTEYADFSIRGKKRTDIQSKRFKKQDKFIHVKDITGVQLWRYGKLQSYCTSTFGGSNNEAVGKDSNMYEFMIAGEFLRIKATDFVSGMPTYWGDQPIVAAPAYIGIVVFFLAIIALFIDKRRLNMYFLPVRL